MRYVLFSQELPEDCNLSEALRWVEYGEYPIYQAGPFHMHPLAGIRPPLKKNSDQFLTKLLNQKIDYSEMEPPAQKARNEKIEISRRRAIQKLFNALSSGKLPARGRLSSTHKYSDPERSFGDWRSQPWDPSHAKLKSIPTDFWLLDGVVWEFGNARNENGEYQGIRILLADLFKEFPEQPAKEYPAERRGDFILSKAGKSVPQPKRSGRPPIYDWAGAMVAAAAFVACQDLNKKIKSAAVEKVIADFFSQQGDVSRIPVVSEIRQRVSVLLTEIYAAREKAGK